MTVARIQLPGRTDALEIDDQRWSEHRNALKHSPPRPSSRLAYAAAHVVMQDSYSAVPHSQKTPGSADVIFEHIDFDATMRFRSHLSEHGFGVAEAMDTAQRMELGWKSSRRLIEQTGQLQLKKGFVAGAWTDHVDATSTTQLIDAVIEQAHLIQAAGGMPIILSMPWLSTNQCNSKIYVDVYSSIIQALEGPLLIHWLGEMFVPSLKGYFPGDSFERIMNFDPEKVRGAKLSILDESLERTLRKKLLERDQIILTGDDYHFANLIEGDALSIDRHTQIGNMDIALGDFSHALLGIFNGVVSPASLALQHLDRGDLDRYREIMNACEKLSHIVFEPPTNLYKVGLAFISWLNGQQTNAMLVNHIERERSTDHLLCVIEAAAEAGALTNASLAVERIGAWLGDQ